MISAGMVDIVMEDIHEQGRIPKKSDYPSSRCFDDKANLSTCPIVPI
jgi:hypothetical protein